ncbi:MAG TPA: DnaA/Hda family protein [Gemmatimonadaceae bacterium]|nr:DnaA/Hda family protein [Gemmatimonadaceae bacterium]
MRFDARFTFDTLVVGAGNRLAAAAARAVAESPGSVYNPLFVYGTTGLGKTHLMGAIAHLAQALQPEIEVEYLSLDEFMAQMHAAISAGQLDAFGRRYERIGLLLLDDVQFLAGKRETQGELLRLFERMQTQGRQIVLTSDRPPSEIDDVDDRLVSRLSGGLIVDVSAPDFETRVAILRTLCAERKIAFKDGMLEELARFEFSNVRELQGALNRLVAHQAIGYEPTPRPSQELRRSVNEFESFLTDVASAVQQHVESWQTRVRERIAYWSGEGYRTGVLQRALELAKEPDVDGLLATYTAAVEHLKSLERAATAADERLGADPVFRDPERLAEAEDLVERALAGATPPSAPNGSFQRDAFDVGPSNQLAAHAADEVVANPGGKYNPLLIHGPSGVGKTHLLNAIGNALAESGPAPRVVGCVHAQKFIDELIAAIQGGTVDRWRTRYANVDALMIDDVQFVAGKERTQEEFFALFNRIVSEGKQIVLTSDRPPGEIPDLEARLRSRFEGGLVVAIQAPDRSLRERLFARYLEQAGRPAPPELLHTLAEPTVQSVREIIGVVNRLGAVADAGNTPLTSQLARSELGMPTPLAGVPAVQRSRATRDASFLDPEKVVWEWPDVTARIIEEFR